MTMTANPTPPAGAALLPDTLRQAARELRDTAGPVELRHYVYATDEFGDICAECCIESPCKEIKLVLAALGAARLLDQCAPVVGVAENLAATQRIYAAAAEAVRQGPEGDDDLYMAHLTHLEFAREDYQAAWDAFSAALAAAGAGTETTL